jgi:AAA15 family ATPase/GTPase
MIAKVEASNFRCFKHLEVDGLKRINLLVGQNSSGKSAFLESLFLSSSTMAPHTVFQMRAIRKMGGGVVFPTEAVAYQGLWEDLFYNFDQSKKISIKIDGQPIADTRSLRIEYSSVTEVQELPFDKQPLTIQTSVRTQTTGMPQIEFTWKRRDHPAIVAKPRFLPTGMQVNAQVDFFPCVWFTPGVGETPDENAKRFSELDKRGEAGPVLKVLTKEFPFIKGLSIDYHAGIPMVFAAVEGKPRKLPVPLVSDGVNRLMGICLGIANYRGGTVLIDQIEDGFHHKLLPSIWNSIYSLAADSNVQMFISTHSAECISAIRGVLEEHETDFSLLRCSRSADGCDIKVLDGKYLETALEQDFEVR